MGKITADAKDRKDEKKLKKISCKDDNYSELKNNNTTEGDRFVREGERMDGESQTKIKHERNNNNKGKKRKNRELKNNIIEAQGLAREWEHMNEESQTKIEQKRKEKKRQKRGKNKDFNVGAGKILLRNLVNEENGECNHQEFQLDIGHKGKEKKKKTKRQKGRENEDCDIGRQEVPVKIFINNKNKVEQNESLNSQEEGSAREGEYKDEEFQTKIEKKKKKNKEKKRQNRCQNEEVKHLGSEEDEVERKHLLDPEDATKLLKKKMEPRDDDVEVHTVDTDNTKSNRKAVKQKKKKKESSNKNSAESDLGDHCKIFSSNKMPKKVNFSEHVEVFSSVDDPDSGKNQDEGIVRGKRFSAEEDEMVKQAVLDYIDENGLGEEGLKKILQCRSHPEVKNCWKHIAAALPWRPVQSVYSRAHILFERDDKRTWTPEELELVRNFHETHGTDWRTLGDAIGKHRIHVKDTWRRLKVKNRKRGSWSQEEYQTLFNLVNTDLRLKLSEERKSQHGMLRDNISWEAISDKLSTRTNALCCQKWYLQLTSSMVAEGKWADADDYRLINALVSLDAACIEDVDWDSVLQHRSGDVCLKRWNQMSKHLGNNGNMSFLEKVDVLAKRYSPDMLEARETYDNKPLV